MGVRMHRGVFLGCPKKNKRDGVGQSQGMGGARATMQQSMGVA